MSEHADHEMHYRYDASTQARLARLEAKYGLRRQQLLTMLIAMADAAEPYGSGKGSR